MADTFFEKFTRCAKICGLLFFFLIVLDWLGRQTPIIMIGLEVLPPYTMKKKGEKQLWVHHTLHFHVPLASLQINVLIKQHEKPFGETQSHDCKLVIRLHVVQSEHQFGA